jgi:predicted O-methyltransferase YrrM
MFESASWQDDRMTLNGLVFRIEHHRRDDWDGGDHFRFFKLKPLIEAYDAYFAAHRLAARNILELGMWDGGSLAFWFETLKPQKIVGVDIEDRQDSPYFRRYVEERRLGDRIHTFWNTDQRDGAALREIVAREFAQPIDLVFDDASHLYSPTKASFETLFPLLRPGGLYVIEDWAWRHWRGFALPQQWSPQQHLTRLVVELVEAAGSDCGVVSAVHVHPGFVGIQRGDQAAASFRLEEHVFRRQARLWESIRARLVWGPERALLARLKRRLRTRWRAGSSATL